MKRTKRVIVALLSILLMIALCACDAFISSNPSKTDKEETTTAAPYHAISVPQESLDENVKGWQMVYANNATVLTTVEEFAAYLISQGALEKDAVGYWMINDERVDLSTPIQANALIYFVFVEDESSILDGSGELTDDETLIDGEQTKHDPTTDTAPGDGDQSADKGENPDHGVDSEPTEDTKPIGPGEDTGKQEDTKPVGPGENTGNQENTKPVEPDEDTSGKQEDTKPVEPDEDTSGKQEDTKPVEPDEDTSGKQEDSGSVNDPTEDTSTPPTEDGKDPEEDANGMIVWLLGEDGTKVPVKVERSEIDLEEFVTRILHLEMKVFPVTFEESILILDWYVNDHIADAKTKLIDGASIYCREREQENTDCVHEWVDGCCLRCGTFCAHEAWDETGVCVVCGMKTEVDIPRIQIVIVHDGKEMVTDMFDGAVDLSHLIKIYLGTDFETLHSQCVIDVNGENVTTADYLIDFSCTITITTRIIEELPCEHDWIDGYCPKCGMFCAHEAWDETGVCVICGMKTEIDIPRIQIVIVRDGIEMVTDMFDGAVDLSHLIKMYLGIDFETLHSQCVIEVNGENVTTADYLIDFSCTITITTRIIEELPCEHDWIDGYCPKCGMFCAHETWDGNGVCVVCGMKTEVDIPRIQIVIVHDGKEMVPITFKGAIPISELIKMYFGHDFDTLLSESVIDVNGENVTTADYLIDFSCTITITTRIIEELPCEHDWMDGSCSKCGTSCAHETWDGNGVCVVCGMPLGVSIPQIQISVWCEGVELVNTTFTDDVCLSIAQLAKLYLDTDFETLFERFDIFVNDEAVTYAEYTIYSSCHVELVPRAAVEEVKRFHISIAFYTDAYGEEMGMDYNHWLQYGCKAETYTYRSDEHFIEPTLFAVVSYFYGCDISGGDYACWVNGRQITDPSSVVFEEDAYVILAPKGTRFPVVTLTLTDRTGDEERIQTYTYKTPVFFGQIAEQLLSDKNLKDLSVSVGYNHYSPDYEPWGPFIPVDTTVYVSYIRNTIQVEMAKSPSEMNSMEHELLGALPKLSVFAEQYLKITDFDAYYFYDASDEEAIPLESDATSYYRLIVIPRALIKDQIEIKYVIEIDQETTKTGAFTITAPAKLAFAFDRALQLGLDLYQYEVLINGESISIAEGKEPYTELLWQSCEVTIRPAYRVIVNDPDGDFQAYQISDKKTTLADIAALCGVAFEDYAWNVNGMTVRSADMCLVDLALGNTDICIDLFYHQIAFVIDTMYPESDGGETFYTDDWKNFEKSASLQDVLDLLAFHRGDYSLQSYQWYVLVLTGETNLWNPEQSLEELLANGTITVEPITSASRTWAYDESYDKGDGTARYWLVAIPREFELTISIERANGKTEEHTLFTTKPMPIEELVWEYTGCDWEQVEDAFSEEDGPLTYGTVINHDMHIHIVLRSQDE